MFGSAITFRQLRPLCEVKVPQCKALSDEKAALADVATAKTVGEAPKKCLKGVILRSHGRRIAAATLQPNAPATRCHVSQPKQTGGMTLMMKKPGKSVLPHHLTKCHTI